jgi:uncharacterized RDD family membrane protein YckC
MRLFGDATAGNKRLFLQLILWMVTGIYFIWCWCKTGQTLATKTWKIKLVNQHDVTLDSRQALTRYALANLSLLACGAGFIWAFVDKDSLFLHDRLMKTRFVRLD